jgi:RNA polymerase sigma-70 factor (ECF subfamily)
MIDDPTRLREVLVRAVASVCPRHLASQRDDIVQNALVRVLGILRKGEQNAVRTTSYLWQAAYTATMDEIRRRSRRREVALDDAGADGPVHAVQPARENEEDRRQVGLEIQDCLGRLAPPRRRAVGLYLFGFGADESARVLGWNVKRAQNLTYRGLADLRRCLEAKGIRP